MELVYLRGREGHEREEGFERIKRLRRNLEEGIEQQTRLTYWHKPNLLILTLKEILRVQNKSINKP